MAKGDRRLVNLIKQRIEGLSRGGAKANPFADTADNLCEVQVVGASDLGRELRPTVRIALVSMPQFSFKVRAFNIAGDYQFAPDVDTAACERRLVHLSGVASRRMLTVFKEALRSALEDLDADIVCFSELGFPSRDMRPIAAAAQYARRMSRAHGALIVAGSVHDSRTLYNTGFLFCPDGPARGYPFHQLVSSASEGALISTPTARRILTVDAFGLRIAVMFGVDVTDYSCTASLVRVAERVDVILVPFYSSRFEKFSRVAIVASRAINGIVAAVNAGVESSLAASCRIARFGFLEPPATSTVLASGALISILTVDHDEFRRERARERVAGERETEWLFGSRDLPVLHLTPS